MALTREEEMDRQLPLGDKPDRTREVAPGTSGHLVERIVHPLLPAEWTLWVDAGIALVVRHLLNRGIPTFSSCQGGEGHCFPHPMVRFRASEAQAGVAVASLTNHGFCVFSLTRYYNWPSDRRKHLGAPPNDPRELTRHWGTEEGMEEEADHFWEVKLCSGEPGEAR